MSEVQNTLKVHEKSLLDKVSLDVFNEETNYIKSLALQGGKKGSSGFNPATNALAGQPRKAEGGMTAAQKNQVKEMAENLERNSQAIRSL